MFTSGTVGSLLEAQRMVDLTCTKVARDAAKDFRENEGKCFFLSGIHAELFSLLCILQTVLSFP